MSARDGRLVALDGGAADPTPDADRPRVVIHSPRAVIAQGLVGLLPLGWRERAAIVPSAELLPGALGDSVVAVIIDGDAPDSLISARMARAHGACVVVLLRSETDAVDPLLLEQADALVARERLEPLMLRLALAAGRVGMRLVPRSLPAAAAPAAGDRAPLLRPGEPAHQALVLLAAGLRDAEIAHELSLSESAVRKLIQRTVRRAGARTRCEAIAAAIRAGELP
ncbi:MAG TPA: hypothetical protein VHX88_06660 [Solirubrobacteraceae bacterium]|nr:hypothetical protein [Solirubrobacteraceae bacterium]